MRSVTSWLVVIWGCLLGLAPTGPAWGQTPKPQWLWAKSGGGTSTRAWQELGKRIEVDASGNSYVLGSYTDTARFGNAVLSGAAANGSSSFIAKYDANGTLQWIHGSRRLAVYDLALDPSGDCYALVKGDTLGGVTLPGGGALSLVRFRPNGRVAARRTVSPRIEDSNIRLAIDRRGRFYVAGSYTRATTIGTSSLPAPTNPADTLRHRRAFMACFSFGWTLQWAVSTSGGVYQDHRMGVLQVDAAGNAYGLVNFLDTLTAGTTTLANTLAQGGFEQAIMKVTAGGQFAWTQPVVRNSGGTVMTGLAVDSAGNSYVTGAYRSTGLFGSTTLTTTQFNAYHYYMVKYDPAGQQEWVRDVRAPTPLSGLSSRASVALDRAGYPYQTGGVAGQVVFGQDTLGAAPLPGGGSTTRAFVVKYTPAGQPVWGINSGSASAEVMLSSLAFDARGQGYLTGGFTNTVRLGATLLGSRGGSDVVVGKISRDTVGLGTTNDIYDLGGRVFADVNGNGQWDAGDSLYTAPIVVEMQPGPFYLTAVNGQFLGRVPVGTYTLSIPHLPRHYTVTTPLQTATFTTPGQVDTTNFFGLYVLPVRDLQVILTAVTGFVPGRNARYALTCRNVGTVPQGGTVTLTLDPRVRFTGSQPAPATVTGRTLTWNVTALAPQQQVSWQINLRVDSTLRAGNLLTSVGQVTLPTGIVDVNPADNTDTTVVAVRTSYDPNDKQVSHAWLSPQQVQNGQWLTYTVRFQNTGNASAQRVIIRDTLAAGLQRASIQVMAQSHNMLWRLKGAGIAEFRFDNIDLPDSTTNEPASHGFVQFRVRVDNTLAVGDSVTNTAGIYFDYNDPIITNTVVTRVGTPVGLAAEGAAGAGFTLYPNPAEQVARLQLQAASAGPLTVRVLNALGQLVWQETSAVAAGAVSRALPVRGWAPGVYIVQVRQGARLSTQRLVVAP